MGGNCYNIFMLIKSGIEKKHICESVVKGQYKPGKAKLATIEFGINVAKVMGFIKEIVRVVGKILTQVVLTLEKVIMSQLRHHGNVYF